MALNLQTFKTRSLTASVFVVVMLAGLLWNHWSFFLLFSIIHFGCWIEYQRLIARMEPEYGQITPFHRYGVMAAGWCLMLYFTNDAFNLGKLSLHSMGWWLGLVFLFLLPIVELLFSRDLSPRNAGYSILGLVYISLSWGFLMDLRNRGMHVTPGIIPLEADKVLPLLLILCLWINDTMAYLVGSLIGRTPFSSISPKKTWEGTLGGAILCVALITYFFKAVLPWKDVLAISAIAAVAGTAGDLLESKLKRKAGVKDSGEIMPGHGGFLDRFDSLLLATPFVWLYMTFLM